MDRRAERDCSFKTSQTIVDFTDMDLNQFISVSGNPALFPGCFKLCVTKDNKNIDYSMLMDSGPSSSSNSRSGLVNVKSQNQGAPHGA